MNRTNATPAAAPNRTYKARLFEMIFSQKKELLELYNAVNGTSYDDPELLEINTLENAIYMSMHNDISFIIDSRLALYEHQSTYSPNLPLRHLMYVTDLYSAMIRDANLYGSRIVRVPTPRFLIFYNGEQEQPERRILRLSDAYTVLEESPALELEAVMLNINEGKNRQVDGVLPDLIRLCQVHPEGTRLCEGYGDLGGRRAGGDGMHRGRDPVGISKQKQSGGEQSEHIRIR
ncbi:MAG: hypothetical protein ACLR71_00655 [[Clostridium] scindens]